MTPQLTGSPMTQHDHQQLRARVAAAAACIAWNFTAQPLIEEAAAAGEGTLTAAGALAVTTGSHTGRSPQDKFIVDDALTHDRVWWQTNAPMRPEDFERLLDDAIDADRAPPAPCADALRRRRSPPSPRGHGVHRDGVARALHPQPPDPRRGAGSRGTGDDPPRPEFPRGPSAPRHPQRARHRARHAAQHRRHRRHRLCRRDQEVGVLAVQLSRTRRATCSRCTARPMSAARGTWRCSSASRAPARRRSRTIPSGS